MSTYRSVPAGYSRLFDGPLDEDDVFADQAAFEDYLSNSGIAYDGQVVWVDDERRLLCITDAEAGAYEEVRHSVLFSEITTDDTETKLGTNSALGLNDGEVWMAYGEILAKTASQEFASWKFQGAWTASSGSARLLMHPEVTTLGKDPALQDASFRLGVDGNEMALYATGLAGTDVEWNGRVVISSPDGTPPSTSPNAGSSVVGGVRIRYEEIDSASQSTYAVSDDDFGKVLHVDTTMQDVTIELSTGLLESRELEVKNVGTGTVALAAPSGATLRSPGGRTDITEQYAAATVRHKASDVWYAEGSLQ